MFKLNKTMMVALFGVIYSTANAAPTPSYISFYFNIHATTSAMTDQQCQDLFKAPREYTIVNDKPSYKPNENYTIGEYQRSNVTFLNHKQYLFTGVTSINFKLNGKDVNTKENIAFVLAVRDQKIQGSFILEGYCKGNFIGVNQNDNQWPVS